MNSSKGKLAASKLVVCPLHNGTKLAPWRGPHASEVLQESHLRVFVPSKVLPDVREVHRSLDVIEITWRCILSGDNGAKGVTPVGPFHLHELADQGLHDRL